MPLPDLPPQMRVINSGLIRMDPRLDPQGNLEEDRQCVRCGYMLRGLPFKGPCPECGTPVRRSFMGDLLEYSDPEYVASLHRGTVLILTGVIAAISLKALGLLLEIVLSVTQASGSTLQAGPFSLSLPGSRLDSVVSAFGVLASGVACYGYWLFAMPDPSQITHQRGEGPRRLLRIAVVADLIGQVAVTFFGFLPSLGQLQPVVWVVSMVWLVGRVVLFFAAMRYVQWLAPRIPDMIARDRARTLAWLGPCLYIFLGCFAMIGPLIAGIMYCVLFDRLRRGLKDLREDQGTLGATVYTDSSRPMQ